MGQDGKILYSSEILSFDFEPSGLTKELTFSKILPYIYLGA